MSLQEERNKTKFPLQQMQLMLWTNQDNLNSFLELQTHFDNTPIAKFNPNYFNLSRKDQLLLTADITHSAKSFFAEKYFNGQQLCSPVLLYGTVHKVMVIPSFQVLATQQQIDYWMPKLLDYSALSCYAQTELGHGSDVQNLQTTATFDKKTNEFVIHTPCVEATKFWPGDLGLNAQYALVFAQMIVGKQNHGVQPFYVQIRDLQTNKPLPQVTIGDIGPKQGYSTKDNGYLSFNQFRVKSDSLLQKYIRIYPNGQVERIGNPKISYAAMMLTRKTIVDIFTKYASIALTIAVRYSIVRTQFKDEKSGKEIKIIDYQTQQDKLFPLLAENYAIQFGAQKVIDLVNENFEMVSQKNDFTNLNLTHSILCATKAHYTNFVIHCSEWCRLSCGGHGFAHYSGFPIIFMENSPNVTLEGENTVLYLQVARFLLKQAQNMVKNPKKVHKLFSFIGEQPDESIIQNVADISRIDVLEKLLAWNCQSLTQYAGQKMMSSEGMSMRETWDKKAGIALVRAGQSYTPYFNFVQFKEKIESTSNSQIQEVLTHLCRLYGVTTLLNGNQVQLIEQYIIGNILKGEHLQVLKEVKMDLFQIIRPNALGLVEASGFSDNTLKTLIGTEDGKVYEKLYNYVTNENSLNRRQVAKGYEFIQKMRQVKPSL